MFSREFPFSLTNSVLLTAVTTIFSVTTSVGDETLPPAVVLIDTSGSMADDGRIETAIEAAKLFSFLADDSLIIGNFADTARASSPFRLPSDFDGAAAELESLKFKVGGSTQYLAGLRCCPQNAQFIIFLSDGVPDDPREALEFVSDKIRCPLHAISFHGDAGAASVLAQLSQASSQGSARNVESTEDLLNAFFSIHQQLKKARRAEGVGRVSVPQALGEVVAVGFGGEPQFNSHLPIRRFSAALPRGRVFAARVAVPQKQDLLVTLQQPSGRLLVLRHDLPKVVTKVESLPGNSVLARARFIDERGAVLDPKNRAGLKVDFAIVDPSGKEFNRTGAALVPAKPEFASRIDLPATAVAQSGWQLLTQTTDETLGVGFSDSHLRSLSFDTPPQPLPPPKPAQTVEELILLRVIAHRETGPIVLRDPKTNSNGVAILGDRLSLELSPSGLSANEFRSLGLTLRAEFISVDGGIREVPLNYHENTFRTAPVEVSFVGILRLRVRVDLQGTSIKIDDSIKICDPGWHLEAIDPTEGLSTLPQFATIPFALKLAAEIDGRPITRSELAEIINRQGINLSLTRTDAGGALLDRKSIDGSTLLARPNHIPFPIWFMEQGNQTVHFTLNGDKRVLAEARTKFQIVSAPIEARVATNSAKAEPWWWDWLPDYFFRKQFSQLSALPVPSPLSTLFYIAGVDVDGQPLDWKSETATELAAGHQLIRVRLERYHHMASASHGPTELQLSIPVVGTASRNLVELPSPYWLLFIVPAIAWMGMALPRLRWDNCRIEALSSGGSAELRTRWFSWIWPISRLTVYRADSSLALATSAVPKGVEVIAQVTRVGKRRVLVKTLAEVQGHNRGDVVLVRDDNVIHIGDESLMTVFGEAANL